jgi:hypoxanthine-guanine phosphoribosyltransferase
LSKQAHKPIHGIFNAAERDAELDKAAYVASKLKAKNVFVVDDLVTRGSTLSRIATAIKASNAGVNVYGVALGKTDRRSFWGNLDNNHVAKAWDDRWQQGEKAYQDHKAKGK